MKQTKIYNLHDTYDFDGDLVQKIKTNLQQRW